MTTLIVTLVCEPADATTAYDYLLTPDGSTVREHSRAPVALMPSLGHGDEVVAMVPARQLSWHQVQLPKGSLGRSFFQDGSDQRLRAVLEGVLEDRLLDDTAQLHFALQPNARDGAPLWVAVCDRAWLRAALQALEQTGRAVSRIVPEFAPDSPTDVLHVVGEPENAWMVCTTSGGVTCWPLSAASVALLNWPASQAILAEPAVVAFSEQLFKRNVTLQPVGQRRLQASTSTWDLAQFDFVNSNRARTWKRLSESFGSLWRAPRWRAARVALLALLLVNLVGLNAWAWKEQAGLKAQRNAINEILTNTFPNIRVVVDPSVQMAKEVAMLHQSSGVATGHDLDVMLEIFAAAAPATMLPSGIEFGAGELRLRGLKLKPAEVSALSFKLKPKGYQAIPEADAVLVKEVSEP
jgi:general secretion pathway protein L